MRPIHPGIPCGLVLFALLSACAGGYRVQTSVESDGTQVDRTVDNEVGIEGEGEFSDYAIPETQIDLVGVEQHCYIDAVRRRKPDGTVNFYLLFSYTGPLELHIVNRKSLRLVIDKHATVVLEGRGEVKRYAEEMSKYY